MVNAGAVTETSRETIDLVRDDGGAVEGCTATWTGTFTPRGGEAQEAEGCKFARAVGDAGLQFSVPAMCHSGSNISADQWRTVLGGIRIEGLTADKMGKWPRLPATAPQSSGSGRRRDGWSRRPGRPRPAGRGGSAQSVPQGAQSHQRGGAPQDLHGLEQGR